MPITSATAQLRTTDLDASIRFYTEVLGLTLAFRYRDFFHLYPGTDAAAALAQTLAGRGVALILPVADTGWGTREFAIRDDQGHTQSFGQDLAP